VLILSRRQGESVKIDDDVTVTIIGVKGNQMRLGFTAPASIAVHREEIYKRMQAKSEVLYGITPSGAFVNANMSDRFGEVSERPVTGCFWPLQRHCGRSKISPPQASPDRAPVLRAWSASCISPLRSHAGSFLAHGMPNLRSRLRSGALYLQPPNDS